MENKEVVVKGVNFAPTSTGKKKWIIGCVDEKYNVWEEKLAKQLSDYLDKSVVVQVRKPIEGTNYLPSITGIGGVKTEVSISPSYVPPSSANKDKSIIAQCLVKAVIGQPKNYANQLVTIEEAVGLYEKAVKLLR